MGLILGGAIGNIIDRIFMGIVYGYGGVLDGHVVDFIHFNLEIWDTPVFPYIFNFADVAISTSIIILILFHKRIMPTEGDEKERAEGSPQEFEQYHSKESILPEGFPDVEEKGSTGSET
jgi:signal peptidase II